MARRVSSPTFVGRSEELAALRAGLPRAAAGDPSVFLVGGDPGVGKSRLLAELAASARADGFRVLIGHCVGLSDGHIPLLPVGEALRELAEADGEDVRAVFDEAPAELAGLLPRWGAGTTGAQITSPHALFELVLGLLRRVARSAPLVLAIEDVHWADRSTLDFLAFVLRGVHDERLLVAVTYRPDELEDSGMRGWLAEATRAPAAERLDLVGLTRSELDAVLEAIVGSTPAPELAQRIFARSEGNAFVAEELLAMASAERADAIPSSLRDMLLVRLEALSDAAQAVVRTASACGRRVHHRLLPEAIELSDVQLAGALRDTVRRHVLVPDGEWLAFRHALLREVAYDDLLPGERAPIHAAIADALERAPALAGGTAATVWAEIAHHRRQAGDHPNALAAAVRAGVEAEGVHAPAEALVQFEHALSLWDRVPGAQELAGLDRSEVAARGAAAAERSGHVERALDLVATALDLVDDPVRSALLLERRGWYLNRAGHDAAALEALDEALRLVPAAPPSAERALVLNAGGYLLQRMFRWAEAAERCEEALDIARRVGAEAEEGVTLLVLGGVAVGLGAFEEGVERISQALDIARRLGRPVDAARAAINLSDALMYAGRLEASAAVALEGVEACRRTGLESTYGAIATTNACVALLRLGRWEEVDRLTREGLARSRTGLGAVSLLQTRSELEVWRGNLAAAAEHQRIVPEAVPGDVPVDWGWDLAAAVAERELWGGDPEAAVAALTAAMAQVEQGGDAVFRARLSFIAAQALATVAELARLRRRPLDAVRASSRAGELSDAAAAGLPPPRGPEARALVALTAAECSRAEGRPDPEAWSRAVEACDGWGFAFRAAYARWRLAEALLASRARRTDAAAPLREAYAAALRLGATLLRREVEALGRRARIDLAPAEQEPASPARGPADDLGLTARELEVLEHLSAGETNRQIAEALFISVKTAGVHVSSILRKLDASTRGEAAAVAHRLGLVGGSGPADASRPA